MPEEPFKASAEEWNKEQPEPVQPSEHPDESNRWGSPESSTENDADRWHNMLYSPETDQPTSESTTQPQETVVINEPTSSSTPTEKKEGFPVWAIVLIVLLVLALCVLCPIGLILGGLINVIKSSAILLPII